MKTRILIRINCMIALIVLFSLTSTNEIFGQSKKASKKETPEMLRASAKDFVVSWIRAWEAKDWVKVMEGIENDGRFNNTGSVSRLYDTVDGLINYRNNTEPPRTIGIDSVVIDITGPVNAMATARYESMIQVPGTGMKVANLDILLLEKQNDGWKIKMWNPQEYFHVVYDRKIRSVWNYMRETTWRFNDASNEIRYLLIYLLEEYKKNGKTPSELGSDLAARFSGIMVSGRDFPGIVTSQVRNIQTLFWKNLEVPEITNSSAIIRFDPVIGMLSQSRNISEKEYLEFFDTFLRTIVSQPGYTSKLTDEGDNWSFTMSFDPGVAMNQEIVKALQQGDTIKAELIRATSLTAGGKQEEATKIVYGLMKQYPDNKNAVQTWIMINAKNFNSAEEMEKGIGQLGIEFPENRAILYWKVIIAVMSGKSEAALSEVTRLISLQPDSAINWSLKAGLLQNLGRYPEALETVNKSIALDNKMPRNYTVKTISLLKMGKYDEALESANKEIEVMPWNPTSFYNRACISSLKGDKAHALADLKKAVEMNPGFKESALKDEDFKSLHEDEDFKALLK